MRKIILAAALATSLISFVPVRANEGNTDISSCCIFNLKKKCTTVECSRRCFTKAICVCGCIKQIEYIEVTYCTTYCDGSTKNWTKIYRA
jgi:hypothetical protein